jgi:hypothetical protein
MPIVDGASPMNNETLVLLLQGKDTSAKTVATTDDQAPLEEINKQFLIDEELRKYHRRLPGSFFIGMGGGMGATYHGPVDLDSHDIGSDGKTVLHVNGGYSPATLFQLLPEIGYQITDRFAMSLQVRFQYTPDDSAGWLRPAGVKAPQTSALAFFLRGQYAFFNFGNFQAFASGVAGGGQRSFLGYVAKQCNLLGYNADCAAGTGHSDTISAGPVAFGAGPGVTYHLSRYLALWLEVRVMFSPSPLMGLAEANGGVAFAHKFDFEKSEAPPVQETVGGWEMPPEEREAPPADGPSE